VLFVYLLLLLLLLLIIIIIIIIIIINYYYYYLLLLLLISHYRTHTHTHKYSQITERIYVQAEIQLHSLQDQYIRNPTVITCRKTAFHDSFAVRVFGKVIGVEEMCVAPCTIPSTC